MDSNHRPSRYDRDALPTELWSQRIWLSFRPLVNACAGHDRATYGPACRAADTVFEEIGGNGRNPTSILPFAQADVMRYNTLPKSGKFAEEGFEPSLADSNSAVLPVTLFRTKWSQRWDLNPRDSQRGDPTGSEPVRFNQTRALHVENGRRGGA